MPRLPNLTNRDDVPEELLEAFDAIAGNRQGSVSGPYGVLLHSPELAIRGAALSNYLRWNSVLTPVQLETAVITTARHLRAHVMWSAHVRLGRQAGVREAVIDSVKALDDMAGLTDEEAEIVRFVRELLEDHRVSDGTFAALHSRLGDQGIVDLTGLVGYYQFVGSTLNAFEIVPGEGAEPLP